MTKTLLFLAFIICQPVQAQDSLQVASYLKDSLNIYPYPYSLNYDPYQPEEDYLLHFRYRQLENGEVIQNPKFQAKDTNENHNYATKSRIVSQFENEFNRYENIPPALDALPDGNYVRYYKNIPYVDVDTVKFLSNKVASIHYLKNNLPNGMAYWFTADQQIVYKKGYYSNSKREGVWSTRQEINRINYNLSNERNRKISISKSKRNSKQTTICTFQCEYKNGLKNGLQVQETYFIENIKDTLFYALDSVYFKNDKRNGKYLAYCDDQLLTSGYFFVDSSNNSKQCGEWSFYHMKNDFKKPNKKKNTCDFYLSKHYIINDHGLTGNSPIIRTIFKPPTEHSYSSIMAGVSYTNFCGEEIEPASPYNLEEKKDFEAFYKLNYSYSPYGEDPPRTKIIDSFGYTFHFSFFEEYYPNGQLKLKFQTIDGNLQRENDTVFWENGKPMNSVQFFPERMEYEEHFYDSLGIVLEAALYDSLGNYLKNLLPKIDKTITIEGISLNPLNDEIYAFGGSRNIKLYQAERNFEDTIQLVSAKYDTKNKNFLEKLYINPQTWSGEFYKELEPNFAFLNATIEFDSLFDASIYKETFHIEDLEISFEKQDTIDWDWKEKYIKPNYRDTLFSPSIYYYGNHSKQKSEVVIHYKKQPFTGEIIVHLDAKKQELIKKKNTIHIHLLKKVSHTPVLEYLFPTIDSYPYIIDHLCLKDTLNYKKKTLKFYNVSTISTNLMGGKLDGAFIIQNYNHQILNSENYSENKKDGSFTLYSNYPFTHLNRYSHSRNFYFRRKGEIDGKKKPEYYISTQSTYKNNQLEGEKSSYNSEGVKINTANYRNGLHNGTRTSYFNSPPYYIRWQDNYIDGIKNGPSDTYNSEGVLTEKNHFKDGYKDGLQYEYYSNGNLRSEFNYKNDTLEGISKMYYSNGKIAQKSFYVADYLKDTLFIYDTNGTLKTTILYNYLFFISGQNYENGVLKNTFENSVMKFKNGVHSSDDSSNVILAYGLGANFNKHQFSPSLSHEEVCRKYVHDSVYYTEYNENGKILKEGEEYYQNKIGLWKYDLPYLGKFTINYKKLTVAVNDSDSLKTIGLYEQKDADGNLISKKYLLDETQLYNCGQKETYEINTYYTLYENDTSLHFMNGFVKYTYPNGVIQSEGINKNGLPTGVWKYYNDDGSLREIGLYHKGKKDGRWLSGDLSKIAYLGDVCLDLDKSENQELLKQLKQKLRIQETFFENGIVLYENQFSLE